MALKWCTWCHTLICQKSVNKTNLIDIWQFSWREMFHSSCRDVSEMCYWIVFWHIFAQNVSCRCFMDLVEMSQLSVRSDISDRFQTVFQINHWQFSDTFIKSDTFLTDFQIFSDRVLTDIYNWLISDIYLTQFWQISDRVL